MSTPAFKLKIDAAELLGIIRANPGVTRDDLRRDFGPGAVTQARALRQLGLVRAEGRRLYPEEPAW